jgi:hypothetical protein
MTLTSVDALQRAFVFICTLIVTLGISFVMLIFFMVAYISFESFRIQRTYTDDHFVLDYHKT